MSETEISETQKRVLRMLVKWPYSVERQLAGKGMAPFLSAANALVRKGLATSYLTGCFAATDAGRELAEALGIK